jgi:hypothetical protein
MQDAIIMQGQRIKRTGNKGRGEYDIKEGEREAIIITTMKQ